MLIIIMHTVKTKQYSSARLVANLSQMQQEGPLQFMAQQSSHCGFKGTAGKQ